MYYFYSIAKKLACYSTEIPEREHIIREKIPEFPADMIKPILLVDVDSDKLWYAPQDEVFPPKPTVPSAELRRKAYLTLTCNADGSPLIPYRGTNLTVDMATTELNRYPIGTARADEIRNKILPLFNIAKEYILNMYPDN